MLTLELAQATYDARWKDQSSWETTLANARQCAKLLGPIEAKAVTQARVDALIARLVRHYRPSTVARKLAALSAMLKHARALGVPIPPVRLAGPRVPMGEGRALEPAEVDRLLHRLGSMDEGAGRLFRFLAATGCRVGEALRLAPERVNRRDGRVFVTFSDTKNGDSRTIPLPASIEDTVAAPFDVPYRTLHARFEKACTDEGVKARIHDLRHTSITRMIRAGVDPLKVGRWHGHRSLKATMRYVHLNGADLQSLADLVG